MQPLNSTDNRYGGTYVSAEDLPAKKSEFSTMLNQSLASWQAKAIKVVWLKVPTNRAELLPIAFSAGFENHHCDTDFFMLVKRLVKGAIVPNYAKHTIGVGGLVINDKNEVLTILEKAHIETHPHHWKFPGGMVDPEEHLIEAVKREVLEETGIQTRFKSFIGFRHHHQGQFTTSNIYAICLLEPLSHQIVKQESEIADAKWFPIDDYLKDEKIHQYNKLVIRRALQNPGLVEENLSGYMNSDDDYEVFMPPGE